MGSVNQAATRVGAASSTEPGAGSADARLAWAAALGGCNSAAANTAPTRHATSAALWRLLSRRSPPPR